MNGRSHNTNDWCLPYHTDTVTSIPSGETPQIPSHSENEMLACSLTFLSSHTLSTKSLMILNNPLEYSSHTSLPRTMLIGMFSYVRRSTGNLNVWGITGVGVSALEGAVEFLHTQCWLYILYICNVHTVVLYQSE